MGAKMDTQAAPSETPDSFADYACSPAEPISMAYATDPDVISPLPAPPDQSSEFDSAEEPKDRTAFAAACLIGASAIWAFQDTAIKDLVTGMAVWQVLFVRSLVAVAVFCVIGVIAGNRVILRPKNIWPHCTRAAWILVSYTTFYMALPYVPVADIATMVYSSPILITLLSIPLLGEKVGIHRSGAVLVGFIGILVISGVGIDFNAWILWPLLSAFAYAMCMITVRKSSNMESALSMTLSLNVGFLILSIVMIIAGEAVPLSEANQEIWGHMWAPWVWPDAHAWILIVALSTLGIIGHFLITTGYMVGEASAVAVFDYAYIPLAAIAAYLMLGEEPGVRSYVGMALIILAGFYVAVRERIVAQRRQRRAALKRTAA